MTSGYFYVLVAILAFLAIFVTGRRLRNVGRSRNVTILTAHKTLSLSAVALLVITTVRVAEASAMRLSDWAAVIAAAALFIATMAIGGVQSARETPSARLRLAHRVTAVLTVVVAAAALYFLLVDM